MSCWFSCAAGLRGRSSLLVLVCLSVFIPTAARAQTVTGTEPGTVAAAQPAADGSDAPDFMLDLGSPTLTVKSSGSATTTVKITPLNSFSAVVNLSCTGAPANTQCGFATSTLPVRVGPTLTTLAIVTGVRQSRLGNPETARALGVLACGVIGFGLLKRRRRLFVALCVLLILPAGVVLSGCGSDAETPAGTSSITITANGAGVAHSQTLQLVVQ